MLNAARELKKRDRASVMQDLIRVVGVQTGNKDYIEHVMRYFRTVYEDAVPEFRPERVEYDNGRPTIPFEQASHLMFQQLSVYKKFAPGVKV